MPEPNAASIMSSPVETIPVTTTVADFLRVVSQRKFSGFPVTDEHGTTVGIISHNDVLRALTALTANAELGSVLDGVKRRVGSLLSGQTQTVAVGDLLKRPVSDLMTKHVHTAQPAARVDELCEIMLHERIKRVVITNGAGAAVGLVSATDLVRFLRDQLTA